MANLTSAAACSVYFSYYLNAICRSRPFIDDDVYTYYKHQIIYNIIYSENAYVSIAACNLLGEKIGQPIKLSYTHIHTLSCASETLFTVTYYVPK